MAKLVIEKFFPGRGNTELLLARYVAIGCGPGSCASRGGTVYVVPTQRKARQVRDMLLQRYGALLGPVVETFDGLVRAAGRVSVDGPVIDDAKKRVLIEDVLGGGESGEGFFGAPGDFPGMINELAALIGELKQNGIMSAGELELRAEQAGIGKGRIHGDLPRVFREYARRMTPGGNTVGKTLVDRDDLVARAAAFISTRGIGELFSGCSTIVFDGFYDFNELQKRVVEAVVSASETIVFALETGGSDAAERKRLEPVFELAGATLEFLRSMGVPYEEKWNEPIVEPRPRATRNLFVSLADFENGIEPGEPVILAVARDREEEVRLIAARIKRKMVDDAGGKFDPASVSVVFPALDKYIPYIREWFPRYGVPFRIDADTPLNATSMADMLLSMLDVVESGFSRTVLHGFLSFPFVSFEELHEGLAGDGISFRANEFDDVAREAQIVGGKPGLGAKEWTDKLGKLRESLKKRLSDTRAGGEEDTDSGFSRSELKRKFGTVDFYLECFKRLSGWFAPLATGKKLSTEEYFGNVLELLELFGVERCVYLSKADGVNDMRRAVNAQALGGLLGVLRECRAALELVPGRGRTAVEYGECVKAAVRGGKLHLRGAGGGVVIMGMFETRGLRFDTVFLGGLIEGEFPRGGSVPFLLNSGTRRRLGLRSIRDNAAEDRMLFFRLFACSRELVLSYHNWEGDEECLRSGFIDSLDGVVSIKEVEREKDNAVYTLPEWMAGTGSAALGDGNADRWGPLLQSQKIEPHAGVFRNMMEAARAEYIRGGPELSVYDAVIKAPELREALKEKLLGAGREFSATQVGMYAKCPFQFFAKYVLKLNMPEEVEDDVTARTRGSLLHDILYDFYSKRLPPGGGTAERVTAENIEDAERELRKIAVSRLEDYPFSGAFWNEFRDEIFRGLGDGFSGKPGALKHFLLRERDMAEELRPAYFELDFTNVPSGRGLEFPGWSCEVEGRQASFRGRVDRIDVAESVEGRLWLVVDYKSGSVPGIRKTFDGVDFQLPLYLLFVRALMEEGDGYAGAVYDRIFGPAGEMGRNKSVLMKRSLVAKLPNPGVLVVSGAKKGPLDDSFFDEKLEEMEGWIKQVVRSMVSGYFHESPLAGKAAGCEYCEYGGMCRGSGNTAAMLENLKQTAEWKNVYVPAGIINETDKETE